MAKKNKSKSKKPVENDTTVAQPNDAESIASIETNDPASTPATEISTFSSDDTQLNDSERNGSSESTDSEVLKLQTENASLKQEVAALRDQLASLESELAELKPKQPGEGSNAGEAGTAQSEYMNQLQDRLTRLKKEQADADAARHSAWTELKRCVQEIARLANPNYVPDPPKAQL